MMTEKYSQIWGENTTEFNAIDSFTYKNNYKVCLNFGKNVTMMTNKIFYHY